jgi:hypothetical protein
VIHAASPRKKKGVKPIIVNNKTHISETTRGPRARDGKPWQQECCKWVAFSSQVMHRLIDHGDAQKKAKNKK